MDKIPTKGKTEIRVSITKVEPLNDKQYYVRGCTALLDTVGGAIKHISTIHKYAREEDRPEKTLFIMNFIVDNDRMR